MASNISRERVAHAVLERQTEKYGDRTFMYWKGNEISFRDLNSVANRVASELQRLGVVKGDKVALILDNCPEFIYSMFGLSKVGAVQVAINTAHRGDILTYMIDHADCRVLIVHGHYLDRVEPILANTPKIEQVIVVDPPENGIPGLAKPAMDWAQFVENDGDYLPTEVLWSDPYMIMYTSGTTGVSKGSVLPHGWYINIGELFAEASGCDDNDCDYCFQPLFHVTGQGNNLITALMTGQRMVLEERFSASKFWEDVKRYGCTYTSAVGPVFVMLLGAEPSPDDANNPLRKIVSGGMPKDLFEPFEKRFGVTLYEAYGLSEVGMVLLNSPAGRKLGTVGKPAPGRWIAKLVDDEGMEVGPNTPGELVCRPLLPYEMQLEYYRLPEKTVETWRDLWFHTGDFLVCDEDGYYSFFDRKKDYLRRRGENISSFELEKVIGSHPAVLESAAIAAKSAVGEDEVLACVALKPGHSLTPLDLIKHCEGRMAYFMVPRYVRFVEALPRTASLRVEKYRLRDQGITPDTWDREEAGYKLKR